MDTNVLYVGLDYHQNSVRVCAMNHKAEILVDRDVRSDWYSIRNVVADWKGPVHAVLESCSGAAAMADELVLHAGWSVQLAHPGYVSRMKQSQDKTDKTDGRVLADLLRVGYVPQVWLAPEPIRELRRLNGYRNNLTEQRRNLKLRIGALLRDQRVLDCPVKTRWSKAWRAWVRTLAPLSENGRWIVAQEMDELERLERRINDVEKRLHEQTCDDPLVQRLLQIPGIGLVTACYLRGSIGRFDRFRSGKQLARFCGLSPRNVSSGARQADAGLIGACDRTLRALLIEAAHRLIRHEKRWSAFAGHLRAQGKHPCVIVAAVANRWMRGLWHELKPLGLGFQETPESAH